MGNSELVKDLDELQDDLDELSSAEDFLEYFDIPFDAKIVQVNRLHIMQRFHDYLGQSAETMEAHSGNGVALTAAYKVLLTRAYQDFVDSDALTEKVFKVFKMHEPQSTFVSVDALIQ
ncbi:MAG: nitrogen fixation protein NifW [Gammaproteobacteria bacterium]|nr:MAG: nitrogen fixation protein NifW [Gammaproteobacteria bacterium]